MIRGLIATVLVALTLAGCAARVAPSTTPTSECVETETRVFFPEDPAVPRDLEPGRSEGERLVLEGVELFGMNDVSGAKRRFLDAAQYSAGAFRVSCLAAAAVCALELGDLDLALELARRVDQEAAGADREAKLVRDVIQIARIADRGGSATPRRSADGGDP